MKETAFWHWFQENQMRFYDLDINGNESLFDELSEELKKIDEHLTFEFGQIKDNAKRDFILSANGLRKSFPVVFNLHELAPALEKWDIIALKPRMENPEGTQLNLSGKIMGIEDLFFEYEAEFDNISIVLYLRADYPYNVLAQIGFIFLDLLLGEYDVATKLGQIDFKPLDEELKDSYLQLIELRAILDRTFPEE